MSDEPLKTDDVQLDTESLTRPNQPETPPGICAAPEPLSLPERHQTALHHIRTLESHNARLYQDNCRLVNAVNILNDRLAFSGAPPNVQVLRLSDMQEKLRASEENRTLVHQKYQELLHYTSTNTGSSHHHIYAELQTVRDAYALLDREYRLLRDKYRRFKAAADTARVGQQQSQCTVRSEFRAHDQSIHNPVSPTSVMSPTSFQPFPDQKASLRRRSSDSIMAQPSLRSSVPTTWSAPLPTPPPSAPLPVGQISPTGFPVHAPVPTASLPHPHHVPMANDPRILPRVPSVTQSQRLVGQDVSLTEQLKATVHSRQRCEEITDTDNNKSVPCDKQNISTPAPLDSSSRSSKRPSSELQSCTSPGGERKKPRTEGESVHSTAIDTDTYPTIKMLSSPASTNPHNDRQPSVTDPDVRSYQDCVDLIFERDADVENGIFCGLCFDRHQAKMIPEPPDVLVQPDFDFLVKHCMTMHPTVWDDLRRRA